MHRRRYLTVVGAGVVGAFAGCGGSGGSDGGQSIDDHPAAADLDAQPRRGDLGGHVVLSFEDPSCTQCRRFHENTVPDIESNVVDAGKGAYVVRTYPIIYPWGEPATQALESTFARSEGAFWALLGHYFATQNRFDADNVLDRTERFLTESTDLDGAVVVDDARSEAHDDAVQADSSAAADADLPKQTPIVLLFRDGEFVSQANGSVSYDLVAEALGVE
ncbi:DsbA family protein [Haloarcula onubensis]|uniref:DsbA family protein n=1 Tax=Haloarcula onubensis TaxID=2950539 RepID=A0ABU2FPU1_9EURY|nr:thioredoxin domain-containing protein [Halomicroarcula sp. S3CR25-11]MDS0282317.1 DsbA family protein [Halomicroarcula sp. S3CR25-11]